MSVDSIFTGPGPDARFRDYLTQGRFCLQYCRDSERYFFYPRPLAPGMGSADWEWCEAGGRGTVYSTTVRKRPRLIPCYHPVGQRSECKLLRS